MNLKFTQADPTQTPGKALIDALSAELAALYDGDGVNAFTSDAVVKPRAAFVVALLDDKPVGCGALIATDETHIAEIKRVYVVPSARGKGLSKKIMHYLETLAADFDYTHLRLETGLRQPAAIALYESIGYARIPCYSGYESDPLSVCFGKTLYK